MTFPASLPQFKRRTIVSTLFAAGATQWLPTGVFAQASITRMILPFPAGNTVDVTARVLADSLGRTGGRQMVVENKTGAGGIVGTSEVVRGKPDGSIILYTTGGLMTNAVLYKKLPYDVMKDLTPITQVVESAGFMLLVRKESPYQSLEQFIAAARAKPGAVSFGSFGIGNTTHLVGELFARAADVKLLHVPYKGSPDVDLLGGSLDSMVIGTSSAIPMIQSGRIRALAVSGNERAKAAPTVPTFAELGFKDVDVPAYSAIWAPAGMKQDLALALRNEVVKAAADPAFQRQLELTGGRFIGSSPEEFRTRLALELANYQRLLPPLGIVLD